MKFNLIYILFAAALVGCYYIVRHLQDQSIHTFFGTAETDGRSVSLEYAVVIRHIGTQVGAQVKQGDTLAIAYRTELDRKASENLSEMSLLNTQREADAALLAKDRDLLLATQTAHQSELQAQIKIIETEMAIQANLRNAVSDRSIPPTENQFNVKQQEIAALREELAQSDNQTKEKLRQIDAQLNGNSTIYQSRQRQIQANQSFLEIEKTKLVVLAPTDGYVQQVGATPNELVPAFRELFLISSRKPDKVIGFLHESAEVSTYRPR